MAAARAQGAVGCRTARDDEPVHAGQLLLCAHFYRMHAWKLLQARQMLPEGALQREHTDPDLRILARCHGVVATG